MKATLIGLFLLAALSLSAQRSYTVKLYQNTDFYSTETSRFPNNISSEDHIQTGRFSLAVSTALGKSLRHELEIWIPEFSRHIDKLHFPKNYRYTEDDELKIFGSSFGLRYEINKVLTKGPGFNVTLAAAINPYYLKLDMQSQSSMIFDRQVDRYGIAFNIIPRFSYTLKNSFGIEINVPLSIYDFHRDNDYIDNPQLPENLKASKESRNTFFENAYTIRFGIHYTFSKRAK